MAAPVARTVSLSGETSVHHATHICVAPRTTQPTRRTFNLFLHPNPFRSLRSRASSWCPPVGGFQRFEVTRLCAHLGGGGVGSRACPSNTKDHASTEPEPAPPPFRGAGAVLTRRPKPCSSTVSASCKTLNSTPPPVVSGSRCSVDLSAVVSCGALCSVGGAVAALLSPAFSERGSTVCLPSPTVPGLVSCANSTGESVPATTVESCVGVVGAGLVSTGTTEDAVSLALPPPNAEPTERREECCEAREKGVGLPLKDPESSVSGDTVGGVGEFRKEFPRDCAYFWRGVAFTDAAVMLMELEGCVRVHRLTGDRRVLTSAALAQQTTVHTGSDTNQSINQSNSPNSRSKLVKVCECARRLQLTLSTRSQQQAAQHRSPVAVVVGPV